MATLGYARVSTQDQDLSGQIEALKTAGATTIYREKVSGIRADRPQLGKLMTQIGPGDIVVVTKLDRLGRSTRRGWGGFPLARGPFVGYHEFAGEAADNAPSCYRGIREGFDPRAHWRRP